jgi:hypothetical protein
VVIPPVELTKNLSHLPPRRGESLNDSEPFCWEPGFLPLGQLNLNSLLSILLGIDLGHHYIGMAHNDARRFDTVLFPKFGTSSVP